MLHSLVVLWIGLVVLLPAFVLAHELGHALVGLARTDGLVSITVGRQPGLVKGRIGRLAFALHPLMPRKDDRALPGLARTFAHMSPRDRVAYALAGPLTHGALALAVLLAAADIRSATLAWIGAFGIVTAGANLLPRKGRLGTPSDGACLIAALRDARTRHATPDASAQRVLDTMARANVRYTVAPTDPRLRAIAALVPRLGYDDAPATTKQALFALGYAGWCWRDAEDGDPDRVREVTLDALLVATRTGAYGPGLAAHAAHLLVIGDTDLGLASPGATDEDRRRFLEEGLRTIPPPIRRSSIPRDHQRFAFRFGVALRDIERFRSAG